MQDLDKQNRYFKAKEKVNTIKKFYSSLLSYVIFISLLAALNYWLDKWAHPWFIWAALGWGIGLVFKAFKTFGYGPFLNKDWEERKIQEYMNEETSKKRWE